MLTGEFPKADLLFTSPPYDDTESYHGSNCGSLATIVRRIVKNFPGTIALSVPRRFEESCKSIVISAGRKVVDVLQMKTGSFIKRETVFEPIVVIK